MELGDKVACSLLEAASAAQIPEALETWAAIEEDPNVATAQLNDVIAETMQTLDSNSCDKTQEDEQTAEDQQQLAETEELIVDDDTPLQPPRPAKYRKVARFFTALHNEATAAGLTEAAFLLRRAEDLFRESSRQRERQATLTQLS